MSVTLGFRTAGGVVAITVDGRPLAPRHDLAHHADSLDWRCPAGALQLALAILAHHCGGDERRALALHWSYAERVVAHLPEVWALDGSGVEAALVALEILGGEMAAWAAREPVLAARIEGMKRRWEDDHRRARLPA